MKDRPVREQLDVAGLEVHVEVQLGIRGERVDDVEQLALRLGEAGNIGMILRLLDVPTDVHEPEPIGETRQDRGGEPRPLARQLLTVEVEVPRLSKKRNEIGPASLQLLEDRHRADELRQAA